MTIIIREGGCNLNSMPGARWHYTEINLGLVCDLCTNSSNWDWSLKEAEEGTYVGEARKWLMSEGVRSLMLSMYDEKYSSNLNTSLYAHPAYLVSSMTESKFRQIWDKEVWIPTHRHAPIVIKTVAFVCLATSHSMWMILLLTLYGKLGIGMWFQKAWRFFRSKYFSS